MLKRQRPTYEIVIVTAIVVLTVAMSIGLYSARSRVVKGNLLVSELANLRGAILLYQKLHRANPPGLEVLVLGTYEIGETKQPYLERLPADPGGKLRDPFGGAYRYDPETGWVSSTTSGYERW